MIYSSILDSKTNQKVAVFSDGRPFSSKYNPEREAEQFAASLNFSDFFLIGGLGSGFQAKAVMEKFPDSRIIILENSEEDLLFLKTKLSNQLDFLNNKNISVTSKNNLECTLLNEYIPAVYSSFSYVDVKSWSQHVDSEFILKTIRSALKKITSDFSVQAYFGKIWQKNIMENLRMIDSDFAIKLPLNKTAAVIAAGPSLDNKIQHLKKERENYYIISTDTAYKSLLRSKIHADCVISVDGQFVSHNHFTKKADSNTLFIFELTGESSAIRKIKKYSDNMIFSVSAHPFEQLVQDFSKESFINLDSTSGTVTVCAMDFAKTAGFKNIELYGADFGYSNGKPYTKGTYLDDDFLSSQNKLQTSEYKYTRLMFRTELIKKEDKLTTEVLQNYQFNFEKWCNSNNLKFFKKEDVYYIKNNSNNQINLQFKKFAFNDFIKYLFSKENESRIDVALLPLISFLRNTKKISDSKKFDYFSKLARNFISRYNF